MRETARWLLLLFAFSIPWEYSLDLGEPVGNISRLLMLVLLPVAALAMLEKRDMRSPGAMQWAVLVLFLYFGVSYAWSIDPGATLARTRGYFQEMVAVWLLWEFAESPRDLRNLLRAYVAGCWVLAALTVLDLAMTGTAGQIRFAAEGQDPNDVARYLELGLPLAALLLSTDDSSSSRWMSLVYLPAGALGVVLTASRGGFLLAGVALAGSCVLLIKGRPQITLPALFALPVCVGVAAVLVPRETLARLGTIPEQLQGGDLNQRWNIWDAGWRAFSHAPFLGTGAGSFVSAAGMAPMDTAHNTALSILVDGGVVGLLVASAVLAACLASALATSGVVRIALFTELTVWTGASMVATVEKDRATWLLFGMIAVAGRLAVSNGEGMRRCFPIARRGTARLAEDAA